MNRNHSQSSPHRRRRLTVFAVGLGLAAGVSFSQGVAHATIKNGTCESGEVCMSDGTNFANGMYDNNDGTDGDLSNNYYITSPAGTVNNTINSTQNYGSGGKSMKWYDGTGGSTFLWCLPYGLTFTDQGGANNRASSNYRQGGAGC